MRARGAIAIVVIVAAFVAGCGSGSTTTGAARRGAARPEDGVYAVGGPGPPPAGGTPPLRGARLRNAEARHVWEGEMVAGEEGWVHSGVGLFWTPDGGRTWRPITPPVPAGGAIDTVYFAGPRRGWALYAHGREGHAHQSIYRTSDGGRTWHHNRLRAFEETGLPASQFFLSLVDGHELFALVKAAGDTASDFGSLFVSHDGGRHWRALPTPPRAGRIHFETPRRGWLVGLSPGRGLWRTVDGGLTWVQVEPGKPLRPQPTKTPPPKAHETVPPESKLNEYRWVDYTMPLIGPGGHGILGTIESHGVGVEGVGPTLTTVWRTGDYGRSWHLSDRIDLPNATGFLEADQVFIRRGRRSLLVLDPRGHAYAVVGPDGHAGALRPSRGLPRASEGLTFSDARHGFAFPVFSDGFTISSTEDGGRSWTQVPVPRATPWPESLAAAAIAGPRVVHRSPGAHGRVRGRPGTQASGVCPAPKGRRVVAFLSSGVPIVPCLLVSPHQQLEIANVTGHDGPGDPPRVETIDLAGFHARLGPGRAVLLAGQIGDYLGPGNHSVGGVTAVDIRLDHTARCEAPKPPPCPGGP